MALAAALCSARFLLLPEPEPTTLPLSRTSTTNCLSWSGPDHDKQFVVEVRLNGNVVGSGSGSSKKRAEQSAAASAIDKLFPNT